MPELTIKELWILVNAGAEKLQAQRRDLAAIRKKWENLQNLLPSPGEILMPAELKTRLDQMAEILKT